jgi:hypothetical protein
MTPLPKILTAATIATLMALPWYLYVQDRRKPTAPPDPDAILRTKAKEQEVYALAVHIEAKTATARKQAKAAQKMAHEAVETRINAGISWADLEPLAAAENEALAGLISALTFQAEAERERGDAWLEAALASQAAADAARNQLEVTAKTERRRGLKWGAAIGAGAVILAAILL